MITYDSRGAGKSPVPERPTDHVADLRGLIQTLTLGRVSLIGHSLGGEIATNYALQYPDEVDKLILVAPGLTGFEFGSAYQQMIKAIWAVLPDPQKMLDIMLHTPEAYALQATLQSPYRNEIIRIQRENVEKSLGFKNLEMIWPQPPAIKRLAQLRLPTLFVLGEKDKADLFTIADLFHQVPRVQFVYVEHADHGLPLTHADELVELVTKFLIPSS